MEEEDSGAGEREVASEFCAVERSSDRAGEWGRRKAEDVLDTRSKGNAGTNFIVMTRKKTMLSPTENIRHSKYKSLEERST
jgi:hypothetical protein